MAVTGEDVAPHLVLDEDDRIVAVFPAAAAALGPLLGRNLWESFPGSRPLFGPYYEKARRTGKPVEFVQFYRGVVSHTRAVPQGRRLVLTWELMHRLDTLTFDGLRTSITDAIAALDDYEARFRRNRVRKSLHVVGGGT